jgi:hypothetical protein
MAAREHREHKRKAVLCDLCDLLRPLRGYRFSLNAPAVGLDHAAPTRRSAIQQAGSLRYVLREPKLRQELLAFLRLFAITAFRPALCVRDELWGSAALPNEPYRLSIKKRPREFSSGGRD